MLKQILAIVVFIGLCYLVFGAEPVWVIDTWRVSARARRRAEYERVLDSCTLLKKARAQRLCLEDELYKRIVGGGE